MRHHPPLEVRFEEKRLLFQRAMLGLLFMAALILILLARLVYLQILDHQKYATLSTQNQLRLVPILPPRGLIYDRTGKLLARNVQAFHLMLTPEQANHPAQTLEALSEIISLDPQQRRAILDKVAHSPAHQPQCIKLKLTEEEVSRFAVNQYRFPGVTLRVDLIRDYPHSALLAHVIGYVSEANKEDLSKLDKKRYGGIYQVGKLGLEKFYEDHLQGQPGYQKMETDVRGREIRSLSSVPAVAGQDLHLTIDLELQRIATQALGSHRGAVVALNPENGEILAMVSTPSYDPNLFVRGVSPSVYSGWRLSPDRPLFNRTIQGQYPPASTIKPIVGLAGLSTQKITAHQKVFCPGFFQINGAGRYYRDWQEKGHATTDLEKSIRESCDIFYYSLAEKLGIQQLSHWLSAIGFGKVTGIDFPGEQKGLVPSIAWKKKTYGTPWYPGETVITGIGQGYILSTPLQLAVMASYLANRGEAFRPHLNQALPPSPLPSLKVSNPQYWASVIEPMRQVVQHPRGTANRYFAHLPLDIAGKTGTAQVFGLKAHEKYEHNAVAAHLRDHSIFVGFAPADHPKIAIAVILENQRASAVVAKQVIEAHLAGKNNVENKIPTS